MCKIAFIGAGSSVFAKRIIGDTMLTSALQDSEIALYDIDRKRLMDSCKMLSVLNKNINKGRAKIKKYLGKAERKKALKDADFVINAIQVGGYEPCTVTDFEIPKKYGLRQTIADTVGIGGIFRSLRTIPVIMEIAAEMEKLCPNAWLLNYTNPQCTIVSALKQATNINIVGLCHSVQVCVRGLLRTVDMIDEINLDQVRCHIAGINHMAWLLEVFEGKKNIYPEIKKRAAAKLRNARKKNGEKFNNMVRLHIMKYFGYYVTESSEHSAEYFPYWIKSQYPELVEEFNIPLDEYPRRCIQSINEWKQMSKDLVHNKNITHEKTHEYGSEIMNAIVTNIPCRIHGNVINSGLITNLPSDAVVEVPCLIDRNGIQPTFVGRLPEQCAALNRTNINTQILTVNAFLTGKKEHIYHAAMLDPHTSAELPLDMIKKLCDQMIRAHGDWLPRFS